MTKAFSYVPLNLGGGNGTQIKNIEGNVTNLMKGFYVDLPSTAVGGGGIVAAPPLPPGAKDTEIHATAYQDQTFDEIHVDREKRGDNFVINARNFSMGPWLTMDSSKTTASVLSECGIVAVSDDLETERIVNGFVRGSEEQFAYILYSPTSEGEGYDTEPWNPLTNPFIQIKNSKINDGIYELLCDDIENGRLYIRYSTGWNMSNLPDPIPSVFADEGVIVETVSDILPQFSYTSNNVHSGGNDSDMRVASLKWKDVSILRSQPSTGSGFEVGFAGETSPILTEGFSQEVYNKTITDFSNDVAANKLHSQTKIVNVDSNDAQNGYVLTATSDTTAEWKAIPAGQNLSAGTNVTITSNQINVGGAQDFSATMIKAQDGFKGLVLDGNVFQKRRGFVTESPYILVNSTPKDGPTEGGLLAIVDDPAPQGEDASEAEIISFGGGNTVVTDGSVTFEADDIVCIYNKSSSGGDCTHNGVYVVGSYSDDVITIRTNISAGNPIIDFNRLVNAYTPDSSTIFMRKVNVRGIRMTESKEFQVGYSIDGKWPITWTDFNPLNIEKFVDSVYFPSNVYRLEDGSLKYGEMRPNYRVFEDHFLSATPIKDQVKHEFAETTGFVNSFFGAIGRGDVVTVLDYLFGTTFDHIVGISTGMQNWRLTSTLDPTSHNNEDKLVILNIPDINYENSMLMVFQGEQETTTTLPVSVYAQGGGWHAEFVFEFTARWYYSTLFVGMIPAKWTSNIPNALDYCGFKMIGGSEGVIPTSGMCFSYRKNGNAEVTQEVKYLDYLLTTSGELDGEAPGGDEFGDPDPCNTSVLRLIIDCKPDPDNMGTAICKMSIDTTRRTSEPNQQSPFHQTVTISGFALTSEKSFTPAIYCKVPNNYANELNAIIMHKFKLQHWTDNWYY